MLLVADTFVADAYAATFDRLMLGCAAKARMGVKLWRPLNHPQLPDLSRFSHMIMSGSEASVVDDHPWERPLAKALREFIQARKPVLGICYSHQFIAKELLGKEHVRHSPTPEFGFREISFQANPLFAGIRKPLVSVVTHFDEVTGLGIEFSVLASTLDCAVQAFQMKSLPVWGVQFHPEYGPGSIEEIFTAEEASSPDFRKRYFDDRKDDSDLAQNQQIFSNFLSA